MYYKPSNQAPNPSIKRTRPAPAFEAVFAFQLLKMRPELAAALVLPEGFLVMVDAAGIAAVADADNRTIFTLHDR